MGQSDLAKVLAVLGMIAFPWGGEGQGSGEKWEICGEHCDCGAERLGVIIADWVIGAASGFPTFRSRVKFWWSVVGSRRHRNYWFLFGKRGNS